jgi:hypothetical protein
LGIRFSITRKSITICRSPHSTPTPEHNSLLQPAFPLIHVTPMTQWTSCNHLSGTLGSYLKIAVNSLASRLVNEQANLQFEYLNKLVSVQDFLSKYPNCRLVCLLTSPVTSNLLTNGNNNFELKWIASRPNVPGKAYFTWSLGTRREHFLHVHMNGGKHPLRGWIRRRELAVNLERRHLESMKMIRSSMITLLFAWHLRIFELCSVRCLSFQLKILFAA